VKDNDIAIGKRVGIDYAGDHAELPLRFWIRGNEFVSRPRFEIQPES
jgi:DNA-3-methyladenine glycosylase